MYIKGGNVGCGYKITNNYTRYTSTYNFDGIDLIMLNLPESKLKNCFYKNTDMN